MVEVVVVPEGGLEKMALPVVWELMVVVVEVDEEEEEGVLTWKRWRQDVHRLGSRGVRERERCNPPFVAYRCTVAIIVLKK